MRRIGLALAFSLALAPLNVGARAPKAGKAPRIARLSPTSAAMATDGREGFKQGMHDLGWVEGKTYTIENRFADGVPSRLPELAAQLVALRVDLILAGSIEGALAAKNATANIPIVMVMSGDPVALGLAASLARPGGNVTGMTVLGQELSTKRLELLKEAVPGVNRVAVLLQPDLSGHCADRNTGETGGSGAGSTASRRGDPRSCRTREGLRRGEQ